MSISSAYLLRNQNVMDGQREGVGGLGYNISKFHLFKFLPSMLNIKVKVFTIV